MIEALDEFAHLMRQDKSKLLAKTEEERGQTWRQQQGRTKESPNSEKASMYDHHYLHNKVMV
jgi:hypothetical protein